MSAKITIFRNKKEEEVARATFDENFPRGWRIESKAHGGRPGQKMRSTLFKRRPLGGAPFATEFRTSRRHFSPAGMGTAKILLTPAPLPSNSISRDASEKRVSCKACAARRLRIG